MAKILYKYKPGDLIYLMPYSFIKSHDDRTGYCEELSEYEKTPIKIFDYYDTSPRIRYYIKLKNGCMYIIQENWIASKVTNFKKLVKK